MNVVIISQDLGSGSPDESDESNIDDTEEIDQSSEFDLSEDSIEDKGFCDENDNYENRLTCDDDERVYDDDDDDDSVGSTTLFQPIFNHDSDILRTASAFQHYHPIPVTLTHFDNQVKLTQFDRLPRSSQSSLDSSFSSTTDSPVDPILLNQNSMLTALASSKRIQNIAAESRGKVYNNNHSFSSSASSNIHSNETVMSNINSTSTDEHLLRSSALNLHRLSSPSVFQSVFRVYNRNNLTSSSSNHHHASTPRQLGLPDNEGFSTMDISKDPDSSLDSVGSSPTELSDDEVSDVFSHAGGPLLFTSTPPQCLRPITRRGAGWSTPGGVGGSRVGASWGLTHPGITWTRTARNPIYRSGRMRRRNRPGVTRIFSEVERTSGVQRPSLDFEKMRKSSFSGTHLQSGINKRHVIKVKNLRNSVYSSSAQLLDPAIYSFRSLSLRQDLRSPLSIPTYPSYRTVHSAPLTTSSSETFDDILDGRGSQSASIDSIQNVELPEHLAISSEYADELPNMLSSHPNGLLNSCVNSGVL